MKQWNCYCWKKVFCSRRSWHDINMKYDGTSPCLHAWTIVIYASIATYIFFPALHVCLLMNKNIPWIIILSRMCARRAFKCNFENNFRDCFDLYASIKLHISICRYMSADKASLFRPFALFKRKIKTKIMLTKMKYDFWCIVNCNSLPQTTLCCASRSHLFSVLFTIINTEHYARMKLPSWNMAKGNAER